VIPAEGDLLDGNHLQPDQWHSLEIEFDTVYGTAKVQEMGRKLAVLRAKRESAGISYLRLMPLAQDTDVAGFLVESINVSVEPESTRE
jgi:hypothetical protein